MTIDMKKVTSEFADHMCAKYGAKIKPKETSEIMKAAAVGLDFGRMFGIGGLQSGDHFMSHITTTLGDTIYMPALIRDGDPIQFIEILTHEMQHIKQFRETGFNFSWLYATESEARVKAETDAYAAGIAIRVWFVANLDTNVVAEAVVGKLISGYHLRAEDAALATQVLKSHLVSLRNGVVMSGSAREAIAWFEAHYPGMKGTF